MPSYTSFDFTKNLRNDLLLKTLPPIFGNVISPRNFTNSNYQVRSLTYSPNIDQPPVDESRTRDLEKPNTKNTYKPENFSVYENLQDLPRRANLKLYPYFKQSNDGLIGILTTKSYDNESELFKFAAKHIKTEKTGPLLSRIEQNLYTSTLGRVRILDAVQGNTGTLVNIIKGREPLVEGNNKITVAKSIPGKVIDFVQTVAGVELPFSEIPGDYLTNPRNPVNVRPTQTTLATKVLQDITGVLGSIIGIDRRPLPSRKPSDLMIEYMGSAQKNRLFDLLSLSKYAPNYTTLARSQQSTKLFDFPNLLAQGAKRVLGTEAPNGMAYIGDDRSNDVKNATSDLFSGRKIKSNYYQTIMFDPELAKLTQQKIISEGGSISNQLTWISKNSLDKPFKYSSANNEQKTKFDESKSTAYEFREDSILETTQQMLNNIPKGGEGRSHIANVIDQTSRFFKEGETMISRGSAVRYVANGVDVGVEYARVWTKDRPYYSMSDTAPYYKEKDDRLYYKKTDRPYRRSNIRKFDGSVMSDTWNLNIAPMSNGNKSFDGSSNISTEKYPYGSDKDGKSFYAKKYMFSIENLAWKTSTADGFTVTDLPFCERGPNGGRVMWFPPYDLSVSEQNSATWDKNTFLGRPEPIYTYQGTERTGQVKFKILVDHPSILNLLVREHFKNMTDEESDRYIHSYFAGAKDIDFYSLIRTYTTLDPSDIEMIKDYLAYSRNEQQKTVQKIKDATVKDNPNDNKNNDGKEETVTKSFIINFPKNAPVGTDQKSNNTYDSDYRNLITAESDMSTQLNTALQTLVNSGTENDNIIVFGRKLTSSESGTTINNKVNDLTTTFQEINLTYSDLENYLNELLDQLKNNSVKNILISIGTNTSNLSDNPSDYKISLRRAHSIIKFIWSKISNKDSSIIDRNWGNFPIPSVTPGGETIQPDLSIPLRETGVTPNDAQGEINIRVVSKGPLMSNNYDPSDCHTKKYDNVDLLLNTAKAYGCRRSDLSITYKKIVKQEPPKQTNSKIEVETETSTVKKPPVDVLKRIIMKTLTESYYFKKLEETSPVQFNSLREKLKYFHPAFHSMTPEGLNTRLTFLNQCVRPGDTIPVKGMAETTDISARNTSFGPPPVCVLRIGDFYHSKVVIKDVNITFDDNVWDLNTDGIGVQPMIATVQLQINFLGGHGLEKPVERLQNALSSNFYANTEMYDERSISTTTTIGGKPAADFIQKRLEELNQDYIEKSKIKETLGEGTIEGQYLGTMSGSELNYDDLINKLFESTEKYFTSYDTSFDVILEEYGSDFIKLLLHPDYRKIKNIDVENGTSTTSIELFGVFPQGFNLEAKQLGIKQKFEERLNSVNFSDLLTISDDLPSQYKNEINDFLKDEYKFGEKVITKINDMLTDFNSKIKDVEENRNKIIKSIDSLNFIVSKTYDVKIENGVSTKAVLSAFTATNFYKNYDECINYVKNNSTKLYSKIDSSINFDTLTFTNSEIDTMIAHLTVKTKDQLYQDIETKFPNYTNEVKRKIRRQIDKFYNDNKIKKKNVRFGRFKKRKNDKKITYKITLTDVITTTDEIAKLFSTKNSVTTKLNFYRNE